MARPNNNNNNNNNNCQKENSSTSSLEHQDQDEGEVLSTSSLFDKLKLSTTTAAIEQSKDENENNEQQSKIINPTGHPTDSSSRQQQQQQQEEEDEYEDFEYDTEPVDLDYCLSSSEPLSLDDFDVDFIETLRCIGEDDDDDDDTDTDSIESIESSSSNNRRPDIAERELRLLEPHEYDTIFNDVVEKDDDDDRQQQQQQSALTLTDDIISELQNNLIEQLSLRDTIGFIDEEEDDCDNNNDYGPQQRQQEEQDASFNFNVSELLNLPLLAESPPSISAIDKNDDDQQQPQQQSASRTTDDIISGLRNNLIELSLRDTIGFPIDENDIIIDETTTIDITTLDTPTTTTTMSSNATHPPPHHHPTSSSQQGPNLQAIYYQEAFYPRKERMCYGHKETIFGMNFSPGGEYLATASQDSDVKIWNVANQKLVGTLRGHDRDYECLRVVWAPQDWGKQHFNRQLDGENNDDIIASAGANGTVYLWRSDSSCSFSSSSSQKPIITINHASINGDEDDDAVPQVYALQFIQQWKDLGDNLLLTSSDDCIHLWELVSSTSTTTKDDETTKMVDVKKAMMFHFTSLDKGYSGVFAHIPTGDDSDNNKSGGDTTLSKETNKNETTASSSTTTTTTGFTFGGERNPDNIVFVFDACFSSSNNLLGVALSDGTVRLVNNRGVCVSLLQLPGCNAHLTSLTFDSKGQRLASVVATGHVILWELDLGDGKGKVMPRCTAVMQGGHEPGRPLFGAKYCGGDEEEFLISWGVDGRIVLWDSYSYGEVFNPLCILSSKSEYPIFAVDIFHGDITRIAVGGGREGRFLGVPVYLYDVKNKDK